MQCNVMYHREQKLEIQIKRDHLLHPKNDSFGILKVFLRILNRDKTELLVLNILITVRAPHWMSVAVSASI